MVAYTFNLSTWVAGACGSLWIQASHGYMLRYTFYFHLFAYFWEKIKWKISLRTTSQSCLFVCVSVEGGGRHLPWHVCKGRRTTCRIWFSLPRDQTQIYSCLYSSKYFTTESAPVPSTAFCLFVFTSTKTLSSIPRLWRFSFLLFPCNLWSTFWLISTHGMK